MTTNEADDEEAEREARAIVVVLGDIGHSPRMCFHASSLANHGVRVELVGYIESSPHSEIVDNANIKWQHFFVWNLANIFCCCDCRLVSLFAPPSALNKAPRPLRLLAKFFLLFFSLFYTLCFKTTFHADFLILQNPPGIPSMLICYLVSVRIQPIAYERRVVFRSHG